ncbi:MAG TPA: SAF domain-containing protein [Candidatus Binatia bacterium]|jgi:predicted homoserine dehydrogenase-like protein
MIIVDNALKAREEQGKPIRVGMIGAGFMGQGLTNQIENSVPGMRMAAVYNRRPERAFHVYRYSGRDDVKSAVIQEELDDAVRRGVATVAEDPFMICRSPEIDVVVDVTGSVEFGAHVILEAFRFGKPVVLVNAEVDSTIGPILRVYAKKHKVILSACDGDEPGLQMNLVRWVKGLGLIPRAVVNVKGLQDPYRNPTTQQGWAERWGQNAAMVTSFADGSKISFEQSIVANATGFKVRSRGMSRGLNYDGSIMDVRKLYDIDELRALGGIVDYTVGPPLIKAFCLAEHPDPKQRHYLNLYKMGEGPLYPFWTPYHLVHFEMPNAIARVVLFGDEIAPPLGGPVVEVCAVAKRDLKAGEVLDEYGMYMTYGEAVNADEMSARRYLPEGLVEGCKLKRDIAKDQPLTYDDVELPAGRLADKLRAEQYRHFRNESWLEERLRGSRAGDIGRRHGDVASHRSVP